MSRPKLPTAVFSHLGPVTVERVAVVDAADNRGENDMVARRIKVQHAAASVEWQTLGHETMHTIVSDAGGDAVLTSEQTEWLCDAFGTWFAAAVAAGWVVVRTPK